MKDCNINNVAAKKMIYLFIVGILPVFVIFILYKNNMGLGFLTFISVISGDMPLLFSPYAPLLSKVMSFYVKASPFYGVLFFLMAYKDLSIDRLAPIKKTFTVLLFFSLLYIISMFFLLLDSTDLATSGKLLGFFSKNEYLLVFLFVLVFYCCYMFTCYYLSFVYASLLIFNERYIKRK